MSASSNGSAHSNKIPLVLLALSFEIPRHNRKQLFEIAINCIVLLPALALRNFLELRLLRAALLMLMRGCRPEARVCLSAREVEPTMDSKKPSML